MAWFKKFKRQIPIHEESSKRNPITMAKSVRQLGRTVDAFLRVCPPTPYVKNVPQRTLLSRFTNQTLGASTTGVNYGGLGQMASSAVTL